MKLTLKTLKGEVINVDIEAEQTIATLKQKVQEVKGIAVEAQKIVYKGKNLNNCDTIAALGIKETDLLVIMALVKKPEAQPKVEEKTETKAEAPQGEQKKEESKAVHNEAEIKYLSEMGFDRQKCIQALQAAHNDTSKAVDYLINGIPPSAGQADQTGQNVEEVLHALMASPQFQPLRDMLVSDPSTLPLVMEQIMVSSPPLYNMIAQNPEAFQRALAADMGEDEGSEGSEGDGFEEGDEGEGDGIHLTEAQNTAINNLVALGFSKIDAAQAYFACDKNEEMAANLLFSTMGEGGSQGQQQGQGKGGEDDDDNLFG